MNKILADRLKEARKSKAMRQDDVAAELGFSRSYISDLENGKKKGSLETIEKLADLFDVSIEFLRGKECKRPFKKEAAHCQKIQSTDSISFPRQKFKHMLETSVESLTCSPQIREKLLKQIEMATDVQYLALFSGLVHRGLQESNGLVEYLMSVFGVSSEHIS